MERPKIIATLPLDVQARIACLEACASLSAAMLDTAREINDPYRLAEREPETLEVPR